MSLEYYLNNTISPFCNTVSVSMSQLFVILYLISIINIYHCYWVIDIGLTYDDWLNLEVVDYVSNGGWNNGDEIIGNATTDDLYHGPFDDYNLGGTTSALTRQIQVSNYGYIRVNYTLIFGCDILNFTDYIEVKIGQESMYYYWIDRYEDNYATVGYPYDTPWGYTIEEYYDPILLDPSWCTNNQNGIGDEISWAIYDSHISSTPYSPGETILFGFYGRFDHDAPYEDDGKFWAATDIVFELIHIETESPTIIPTQAPSIQPSIHPTAEPAQQPSTTNLPSYTPS